MLLNRDWIDKNYTFALCMHSFFVNKKTLVIQLTLKNWWKNEFKCFVDYTKRALPCKKEVYAMTFTVLSLVASFVLSVLAGVIANYISKKIDESDK